MNKFKSILAKTIITLGVCGIVYGIGYLKYNLWKAEHPQAKTWTFFIPSRHR